MTVPVQAPKPPVPAAVATPPVRQVPTIAEALDVYTRLGKSSVTPTFRKMVEEVVQKKLKIAFDNDCYSDALFLADVMFENSKSEIRILSGPSGDGFLQGLERSFCAALERIAAVKGAVKIILLAQEIPASLKALTERFSSTLQVALGRAAAPVQHFIVCDSNMARLEEIHGDLTPETMGSTIKAKVHFNDPETSKHLEAFFDAVWSRIIPTQAKTTKP